MRQRHKGAALHGMSRSKPAALLVALVALLAAAPTAAAQSSGDCTGDFPASAVEQRPGPALRFGITPSGAAGQIGPLPSRSAPDRYPEILAALAQLRPRGGPFVTHVYTSWGSDSPQETARLADIVDRYSGEGYLVELVLRYKPTPQQEGDVAGFGEYVRRMVRTFGPNRRVVAFQITNEVNLGFSGDSSDGFFRGAQDALIQGVIAASDEKAKQGYAQLEIGFNWFYRTDPDNERRFWEGLRDRGGPSFVAALDWIGLDAYPSTFFPPETPPAGAPADERSAIVNALSTLRCFAKLPGIPKTVPIHVQENGYPTGPGQRTYERQAQTLTRMVQAFHDFRGTYNVSDYRWFNLRDAETASPNFQQQYGLMTDDYRPKPAFHAYRQLIDRLALRSPPPRLRLQRRPGICVSRRGVLELVGSGTSEVQRVDFRTGNRSLGRDTRAPFRRRVTGARNSTALVRLYDGREFLLVAPAPRCARRPSRPHQAPPSSRRCRRGSRGVCARNQRGGQR